MSLFDTVVIKCKLPDSAPNWLINTPCFQTHNLMNNMSEYLIDDDRNFYLNKMLITDILCRTVNISDNINHKLTPVNYKHKKLFLYASNLRGYRVINNRPVYYTDNGELCVSITYSVWIYNGKAGPISLVRYKHNESRPYSQFNEN